MAVFSSRRARLVVCLILWGTGPTFSSPLQEEPNLDERVLAFLEDHRDQWRDLNVSWEDGRALYDLILERRFTRALEIGTSTGHSAIWMAWALGKTSGKLTTIEIDERRYHVALENFEAAGVAGYIDARLADAHELVPKLAGPFDFVFCDADKTGYVDYLRALLPKLETGGCIAAHNVLQRWMRGIPEFLAYAESLPELETIVIHSSSSGISLSCKTADAQRRPE